MRFKNGGFVLACEERRNLSKPLEWVFLIILWTLIPGLILFFIVLGLSFFRVSLLIQVLVVIFGIVILTFRAFRLYRGVRMDMLANVKAGPEY